ncbi:uncharacterized protein LOC135818866 [Sycon ciliatum]|uniref:uncharacterized protein LOC135818866 n=1 Tax=Sycon ciliatum TaxID=27933 RepID=UPI0031F69EBD
MALSGSCRSAVLFCAALLAGCAVQSAMASVSSSQQDSGKVSTSEGSPTTAKLAPAQTNAVWPDGKIMVKFAENENMNKKTKKRFHNLFQHAAKHIEERSCVRFYRHVDMASQGDNFVTVELNDTWRGCQAPVGMLHGESHMKVGSHCRNDLGHLVLGLLHVAGLTIGHGTGMNQIEINTLNGLYRDQCTSASSASPAQRYVQFEQRISISLPDSDWLRCEDNWNGLCAWQQCPRLSHPTETSYRNCRASEFYLKRGGSAIRNTEEVLRSGDQVYLMVRPPVNSRSQEPIPLKCHSFQMVFFSCRPEEHTEGTPLTVHALNAANSGGRELITEATEIALCFKNQSHTWCFWCKGSLNIDSAACSARMCDGGPQNCTRYMNSEKGIVPMKIRQWRSETSGSEVQYKRTISLRAGVRHGLDGRSYLRCTNSACGRGECLKEASYSITSAASNTHSSKMCDAGVFRFVPVKDTMPDDGLLRYDDMVRIVTAQGQPSALLCIGRHSACVMQACTNGDQGCLGTQFIVRRPTSSNLATKDGQTVLSDGRVALCTRSNKCIHCRADKSSKITKQNCRLSSKGTHFFISQWQLV